MRIDLLDTIANFELRQNGLKKWIVSKHDDVTMSDMDVHSDFDFDLYGMGDYKKDNFIYSIDEKKWVLIDP